MCRKPVRFVAMLCAAAVFAAPARADDARLIAEGIAVLRAATVIETQTAQESSPCRIDAEWSRETIPHDIARRVFGIRIRANLAAGSPVPDSYAVLSAVEPDPARLCSKDEIGRQRTAARAVLPNGAKFSYHVASYTFPVFDPAFTKAVVVWTSLYSARAIDVDEAKPGGVAFTVTVLTFAKVRKRWTLIGRNVLGQT